MLSIKAETGRFVVSLNKEQANNNKSRILTKAEVQSLRDTKKTVAERISAEIAARKK